MIKGRPRIKVRVMRRDDLPFLRRLWAIDEVMRYADEFPSMRGWKKSDPLDQSWMEYRERRKTLGRAYTQLILELPRGTRVGESFFAPLPEGYTFGRWLKPRGVASAMGDIKLLPSYWGRGLGTAAMHQVVAWMFGRTSSNLLAVPPHLRNPAAERVYAKAGFVVYRGMRSAWNHRVMELSRERYGRLRRGLERPV